MTEDSAPIRSVCVYCGSAPGLGDAGAAHRALARQLGAALAEAGLMLVYGAGGKGLMGEVARAAVAAGGRVTGIAPVFMTLHEGEQAGLAETVLVDTMHERKHAMAQRADAFVALPGGLGTLEEVTEILTWRQLGLHDKPVILLDAPGSTPGRSFFGALVAFLDEMMDSGYLKPENRARIAVCDSVAEVMARLGGQGSGVRQN